ncbi:MAG: hypothetical protein EXR82_10430, partial [Gammaproteobacteria bacterium]|nr:hypothetical protein [Gammaproteobacteria bacterium]
MKRVFQLDLGSCEGCGGQVRVVACLEDPLVIGKILEHLARSGPATGVVRGEKVVVWGRFRAQLTTAGGRVRGLGGAVTSPAHGWLATNRYFESP